MKLLDDLKPAAVLMMSLSRELFARSPLIMVSTVSAGVVAHLTRMLAFLLPLKIVLLASSNSVPSYMNRIASLENLSLESWISLLVLLSVICYVASVLLEGLIGKLLDGYARSVVRAAPPHVENRDKSVPNLIRKVHIALVALCFVIIATVAIGSVMASVAAVLLVTLLLVALISMYCYERFDGFRQTLSSSPKQFVAHVSSTVFLIGFSAVLYGVLVGPGVPAIKALISLILLRICTNMLQAFWASGKALYDRESEASQLFLGRKIANTTSSREKYEDWLAASQGDAGKIVDSLGDLAPPNGASTWAWLGNSGRVSRTIVLIDAEKKWTYAIRSITGVRLSGLNRYRAIEPDLAAHALIPPLIGSGRVDAFESLVFDVSNHAFQAASPERSSEWTSRLWSIAPDKGISGLDFKVRGKWHEAVDRDILKTISVGFSDEKERQLLLALAGNWSTVTDCLDTLPVSYSIPAASELLVFDRGSGLLANLGWEDWVLLPVGVILSASQPKFDLAQAWQRAVSLRPSLAEVTLNERELAALVGRFVAFHKRGDYAELPPLADEILKLELAR